MRKEDKEFTKKFQKESKDYLENLHKEPKEKDGSFFAIVIIGLSLIVILFFGFYQNIKIKL